MKLSLLPEADSDIDAIIRWYEEQQAGLGLRFYTELYELLKAIELNPGRCPWLDEVHRRCTLRVFKYGVVYRMGNERIIVLAVMHLARDPDSWRVRIQ